MKIKYILPQLTLLFLLPITAILVWQFRNSPPQYLAFSAFPNQRFLSQSPQKSDLTLLFAGDVMSQYSQIKSAQRRDDTLKYDYNSMFRYIKPILQNADLAIGNLECTLSETPPYTGAPFFRSPDALADALKRAGFDLLFTANNHANDYGKQGVIHTIKTLEQNHFFQSGTFEDSLSYHYFYPLIVYKNGFKLAFVNATMHTNGIKTTSPTIVNRLESLRADLAKARSFHPDFIIAFVHWGVEHQLNESEAQRLFAQDLYRWGADLVIGAHPHVIQPIKNEFIKINGKNKSVITAYSLGNFMSDQPFPNTEGGLLFELTLHKNAEGGCDLGERCYIPIFRHVEYGADGRKQFQILPISQYENEVQAQKIGMSAQQHQKMQNFIVNLRTRLAPFGVAEKTFEQSRFAYE